jgi:hypothetical protein
MMKSMLFAKVRRLVVGLLVLAALAGVGTGLLGSRTAAGERNEAVVPVGQSARGEGPSSRIQEKVREEVETKHARTERKKENPAEPNPSAPWANKLFTETSKDFGDCTAAEPLKHRFEMSNIYAVPLQVVAVKASSACVTWTLEKKVLKPRETGYLEVRLDPRRFLGARTVTVFVTVGPEYVSTATITLKANHPPPKPQPNEAGKISTSHH